jgi:hypothetical protein
MKNIITEELGYMKYLLRYNKGVVISEQQRPNKTGCIEGNCENGKGDYKWSNGDVYKGQWKDGKLTGQGIYKWKDGTVYEGGWKDGKQNGQGTNKWPDGAVYVGQFKDDFLHGQGTYTNPNGEKFSGTWVDGKLDGKTPEDLDKITQSNTECAQPTEPTHRYKDDKNYRYAKSGDCWWAKNINNNKWFNLTELVKTKPNIQISIDRLNDGTNLIKL